MKFHQTMKFISNMENTRSKENTSVQIDHYIGF